MNSDAYQFLRQRARNQAAGEVLSALTKVLSAHADEAQLRSVAFEAGRELASRHPLAECETLADFERAGDALFRAADWGTLSVETADDSVTFVHGAPPQDGWGPEPQPAWMEGLFEGVLAEWMRHLGAGDGLDVRYIGKGETDTMCYRLAHRASFSSATREQRL